MNKRDELILKYVADLKDKCGHTANEELLRKVTVALGPSIYNADSSTVSSSDESELERLKTNFLVKKLGLSAGDKLDEAINGVMETYGKSNRNKYRAVVYYLLTLHFKKENVYN
ncbi:MAG: hypothetical protein BM564_07625 [Bacteroidetes bacterium MedPE-SWsnd-G2]|nr:MAG: hypothetical protein BM564_07625 [Bacteroidetes bacterium MedPE-SWsnd-G2]